MMDSFKLSCKNIVNAPTCDMLLPPRFQTESKGEELPDFRTRFTMLYGYSKPEIPIFRGIYIAPDETVEEKYARIKRRENVMRKRWLIIQRLGLDYWFFEICWQKWGATYWNNSFLRKAA